MSPLFYVFILFKLYPIITYLFNLCSLTFSPIYIYIYIISNSQCQLFPLLLENVLFKNSLVLMISYFFIPLLISCPTQIKSDEEFPSCGEKNSKISSTLQQKPQIFLQTKIASSTANGSLLRLCKNGQNLVKWYAGICFSPLILT